MSKQTPPILNLSARPTLASPTSPWDIIASERSILGFYDFNLTQNTCLSAHNSFVDFNKLSDSRTADDFFTLFYQGFTDTEQAKNFSARFNRQNLLNLYEQGQPQLTFDSLYAKSGDTPIWIETTIHMLPAHEEGQVEGCVFITSVEKEKRVEFLIEQLFQYDYEYLMLLNLNTGMIAHVSGSQTRSGPHLFHNIPYQTYCQYAVNQLFSSFYREEAAAQFSLKTITQALKSETKYIVQRPVRLDREAPKYKKWTFSYLDQRKNILICTRRDITADYEGNFDLQTGLYNRKAFTAKAASLIKSHRPGYFALISTDINNFKVINDRYGHEIGDQVLHEVGQKLLRNLPREDEIACHDVADMFLILLPNVPDLLNDLQEGALKAVTNVPLPLHLKFRFGVFIIDDINLDVNLMIDRATLAQRSIKHRSQTIVSLYNDSMRQTIIEEQQLADDAEAALRQKQFQVWFQPQYDYSSNKLIGTEALVRWQHPKKGLLVPGRFIPLFERNGFISKLDQFVWEESCRYLRAWQDKGQELPVSVNVSRINIYNPHLCSFLTGLVERYNLKPSQLKLEITESAYIDNEQELLRIISQLHHAGFSVEMDDFGSGFSSLNMLKSLPVDLLKLDMRFLDAGNEERGGNILSSVIRMAHWLRLPVVAEGVETQNQADYLKSLNCSFMQGYYFAKPMPATAFTELLENSHIGSRRKKMGVPLKGAAAFWDPSAQTVLLFNSFIGGAYIAEYYQGNLEMLRSNDNFYQEINLTREEFLSYASHFQDCFDPENRKLMVETVEKTIRTGKEEKCITKHSLPSAGKKQTLWTQNCFRILDTSDNRHLFYVSVQDVTEHLLLEQKLEQANLRLKQALALMEAHS